MLVVGLAFFGLPDWALPLAGIKRRAPRPAEPPVVERVVADDRQLGVALDDVTRVLPVRLRCKM